MMRARECSIRHRAGRSAYASEVLFALNYTVYGSERADLLKLFLMKSYGQMMRARAERGILWEDGR